MRNSNSALKFGTALHALLLGIVLLPALLATQPR
jgi:hypothetical protein